MSTVAKMKTSAPRVYATGSKTQRGNELIVRAGEALQKVSAENTAHVVDKERMAAQIASLQDRDGLFKVALSAVARGILSPASAPDMVERWTSERISPDIARQQLLGTASTPSSFDSPVKQSGVAGEGGFVHPTYADSESPQQAAERRLELARRALHS